jgi:hypothetical protein
LDAFVGSHPIDSKHELSIFQLLYGPPTGKETTETGSRAGTRCIRRGPAAASVGGPPFLRSRQRASEADQDLSEFLPHLDAMSRAFDGQQTGKQREPGHLYQSEFFLCMAP